MPATSPRDNYADFREPAREAGAVDYILKKNLPGTLPLVTQKKIRNMLRSNDPFLL
jgi:hypothetical protein